MDTAAIRRDLHDMETHREAWASILRQASDHAISPDVLLEAARTVEAASASFSQAVQGSDPKSLALALGAVDRLVGVAQQIFNAIDALSGSAGSRHDAEGFKAWLAHERSALAMLCLERSMIGLTEKTPA